MLIKIKRFTSVKALSTARRQIRSAISIFSLILFCGCSNPEEKAVNSFKTIVEHLQAKKNKKGTAKFADFSFNVKKSDSLVSPFLGVLNFKFVSGSGSYLFECQFAMQDGKWIHKNIDVSYESETQSEQVKRLSESLSEVWILEADDMLSKFLSCPKVN